MELSPGEPASLGAILLLGLLLGLRHALDPDHLAAVLATVSRYPKAARAVLIGALWGLGHAASILLVGGILIAAGLALPAWAAALAEAAVGIVLIALGADLLLALWALRRDRVHLHVHAHEQGGPRHLHLHSHRHGIGHGDRHEHAHPGQRAFLVGMAHGLAGSAALAVLVGAATSSVIEGLLFLLAFGAAATVAMALATATVGVPIGQSARSGRRVHVWVRVACAVASIGVGVAVIRLALAG